jgi:type II secretory pathway pseudopilin PulG
MVILDRPAQDNNTLCALVQRETFPTKPFGKAAGVTLTELLVTITAIAALALITMPAWSQLTRSQGGKAAASLVMGVLEQARIAATSGQKEVWVILRHAAGDGRDGLRIVSRAADGYVADGTWVSLPSGISFQTGANSLMDEKPPGILLSQANNATPGGKSYSYGGLMFQRTGRVGIPKQEGNTLSIILQSSQAGRTETIALSRATGRASLR